MDLGHSDSHEQGNNSHLKGSYYPVKVQGKSRQFWGVMNCENCLKPEVQVILKGSGEFYHAMESSNW
jgi:hypothetical protein